MNKINYFFNQILILAKGSLFILNHPANNGKIFGTLRKMVYWKINKHFMKKDLIAEIANGVKCICPYWSSYGGIVYMTGSPEYWESKFFLDAIDSDSIVLIVGANIGYYSLLAASKATSGFVYSFDADPRVTRVINKNIRINGYASRVKYFRNIVSDKVGKEAFIAEKESEMSHIAYVSDKSKSSEYPSITLDKFVGKNKIGHIRIVKIDV